MIQIEGRETPVPVLEGDTVLTALKRAEVPIGYSCESGKCGSCKCELLAGSVEQRGHSEFALSAEQAAHGVVLACRAVPQGDVVLRIQDADELVMHPRRHLQCRLLQIAPLTPDIYALSFHIEAGGPLMFSAGQYAKITFIDSDGAPMQRDFSIASTPVAAEFDERLEFHIRAAPGGSFERLLHRGALQVGQLLDIDAPEGTGYLRTRFDGPMVFVAGGSGLAPVLSMVETAIEQGMTQPIHVLAGMRTEADVYGEAQLRMLAQRWGNLRVDYVLSEPDGPTHRRIGLVTDVLAERADFRGMKAYLAGPPPMVEAAARLLLTRGLTQRDIHADAYYNIAELRAQSTEVA